MFEYLQSILYTVPAMLIAVSAHEFAHGYVSYKMGDPTPKNDGRLTLNPLAHLDITGTICLMLFHMGWAKPVRISPSYYRDRKKGIIAVSLAGPVMNYLLAFISTLLCGIFYMWNNDIWVWFYYSAVLNIGLGTFNLIPLPPLDGSNVLSEIFPQLNDIYRKIRPYSMVIMLVLLSLGILREPLNLANDAIFDGMWNVVCKILNVFVRSGSSSYL